MAAKAVTIFNLFNLHPEPRRARRLIQLFTVLLLLIAWHVYYFKSSNGGAQSMAENPLGMIDPVTNQQILDLSHLKWHVRTPEFTYAHRTIKTKRISGQRPELTTAKDTLYNNPLTLEKAGLGNITITADQPLTLEVPSSPRLDTSIISFGIATQTPRLADSLPNLAHWLPNSGAQLHVHSEKHDRDSEVQAAFSALDINLTVHPTALGYALAYFSLIKTLYDARTPQTRWLVLIDDDSFIPSLPYLVSHLTNNYNPMEEVMVAPMSDDIEQIGLFGMIPFGGGGIFISIPLAAHLTEDHIWQNCMQSTLSQGDQVVNACLNAHTRVRPVFDRGLNQMDIEGDASGYFESGRRMLTLHHWHSWFHVNVPAGAIVSQACGDEGIFQRWRFDQDTVLSNGYSIAEYPLGMSGENGEEEVNLSNVEKTWASDARNFEHFIGPLREPLGRDRKRQLKLVQSVVLDGLGVRQTYTDLKGMESAEDDIDRVVELLWLF